jgi:hypothetical protein
MSLDQIVDVLITRETLGITERGFGVPLIFGPNAGFSGVRTYNDIDGVAEDFSTTDPEYIMASKIFSQEIRPPEIKMTAQGSYVAQSSTLEPDVDDSTLYTVTINGEVFSYTSAGSGDTATDIVAALLGDINASTQPVTATGTTTLILTADNAGEPFTLEFSATLDETASTANVGPAEGLQAAVDADPDWYFLLTAQRDPVTVAQAAAFIEARERMYLFLNDDADVITDASDDLVSTLGALNYDRTAAWYTKDHPAERLESAIVGRCAPLEPGSETWNLKRLAAVPADSYSGSERNELNNKTANYYVEIAGVSVTQGGGKVLSGEFMDIIRLVDKIKVRIQERIFVRLASVDKIPFTNSGIAVIESEIDAVLRRERDVVGSLESYEIEVPLAADVPTNDKANRRLTGISFVAQLSGAIHTLQIRGRVVL